MVLQSTVHTVGGVITAGDAIMMIVPQADDLSVEAKVNPQDIDKLQIGQKTLLRLSAFNQRTTPELNGVVTRVSADVTTDQRTGQSYYTIRVSMPPEEVARLGDSQDHPGHAGRSLRADRRPHHVVLSDEAVQRPADALVPGEVRFISHVVPANAGTHSPPASIVETKPSNSISQNKTARRMGPCVRRDDSVPAPTSRSYSSGPIAYAHCSCPAA